MRTRLQGHPARSCTQNPAIEKERHLRFHKSNSRQGAHVYIIVGADTCLQVVNQLSIEPRGTCNMFSSTYLVMM